MWEAGSGSAGLRCYRCGGGHFQRDCPEWISPRESTPAGKGVFGPRGSHSAGTADAASRQLGMQDRCARCGEHRTAHVSTIDHDHVFVDPRRVESREAPGIREDRGHAVEGGAGGQQRGKGQLHSPTTGRVGSSSLGAKGSQLMGAPPAQMSVGVGSGGERAVSDQVRARDGENSRPMVESPRPLLEELHLQPAFKILGRASSLPPSGILGRSLGTRLISRDVPVPGHAFRTAGAGAGSRGDGDSRPASSTSGTTKGLGDGGPWGRVVLDQGGKGCATSKGVAAGARHTTPLSSNLSSVGEPALGERAGPTQPPRESEQEISDRQYFVRQTILKGAGKGDIAKLQYQVRMGGQLRALAAGFEQPAMGSETTALIAWAHRQGSLMRRHCNVRTPEEAVAIGLALEAGLIGRASPPITEHYHGRPGR